MYKGLNNFNIMHVYSSDLKERNFGGKMSLGRNMKNSDCYGTISRDRGSGMIKWLSLIIRTFIGCAVMFIWRSSMLVLRSPSPRAQFELTCVFRLLFSGWKRAFNPRQRTNFWVIKVTKLKHCKIPFRLLKKKSEFLPKN